MLFRAFGQFSLVGRRRRAAMLAAFVSGLALGILSPAKAGPLQLERVDAQATWLIHADLDAMRANAAGQEFLRIGAEQIEELAQSLRQELGVDLLSQVRSVTIYGPSLRERAGVTLIDIDASVDIARFVESKAVAEEPAKQEASAPDGMQDGTHDEIRVLRDGASQSWYVAQRSRDARTVCVVGDDAQAVRRAAGVLDGTRASMRTSVVLNMLGPSLAEVPGQQPVPQVAPPKWPFDRLPAIISDRVMLMVAIAQLPGAPECEDQEKGGDALPTIARTQGILARLGEIRDETQTPWVEADLSLRMADEKSAQDMERMLSRLIVMLASAHDGKPVASSEAKGGVVHLQELGTKGLEIAVAGRDVHVTAKERLEDAVKGLAGGEADGAVAMLRMLRTSQPASEEKEKPEKP